MTIRKVNLRKSQETELTSRVNRQHLAGRSLNRPAVDDTVSIKTKVYKPSERNDIVRLYETQH